jgi:hypothetical protein
MADSEHLPLSRLRILERLAPTFPQLADLEGAIRASLDGLRWPGEKLRGKRIAVSAGSRGIAHLKEIVRACCNWLKAQGARPFVFPGMGSHGGGTAEGQRRVLAEYGVIPEFVGCEILSNMETVPIGNTPEGFAAFMDRNAWQADGVMVMNRVKPHTSFSGNIESGLCKMMAIGMAKREGAHHGHLLCRKYGYDKVLRAIAAHVLSTGKILGGLAIIENEFHQVCTVRAALPDALIRTEEEALVTARALVPRIPFPQVQLLVVDEMGKNISGTGMDGKIIGRGVELPPGEAPQIGLIYCRDLTDESDGNGLGMGFADLIHERLFRKVDLQKVYVNARTSMNPWVARLPIYLSSDREALDFAIGSLGSPSPQEQRLVWIRSTVSLNRLAIGSGLVPQAEKLAGWELSPECIPSEFDGEGNLASPL